MSTVTFDHLFKRYGEDVIAVNDLNLEIGDGEFICPGRTFRLRQDDRAALVAGLEEITDGRILIGDRVVNNVAPKDRDIAMVFQSYALYPHMSVYDNLAFGLKLRKIEEGGHRAPGQGGRRDPRPREVPRPQAEGALRRTAAARGARPRHRPRADGLPDGRAALATSTPSSACRRARRSPASTSGLGRRRSTSPTTRSRR